MSVKMHSLSSLDLEFCTRCARHRGSRAAHINSPVLAVLLSGKKFPAPPWTRASQMTNISISTYYG